MAVNELLDQSISSPASTTPLLSKLSSEPSPSNKPSNSQTPQFTLVATTTSTTTTEKQEPPQEKKKSQDSNNNSIVSVKQNVKQVEVTSESQSAVINPVSSRTPPTSQQKVCSGASESVAALIVKEFGKFEPTTPEEDLLPPRKRISGRSAPNLTETEEEKSLLTALADYMELHAIHPVVKSFLVGSISGTCSTVLFQPLDLLKTRLQGPKIRHGATATALRAGSVAAAATAAASPHNFFTVLNHVVRNEKVFGLWKGMTPSLTRCVPGVGLYFASIHGLKIAFDIHGEPTAVQSVLLGVTGRSISGVMMIPFTVIKTRFESTVYHYGSIREALYCIYRKEGFRGLTCGLLPTLLRDAPFSGLYLLMYTSTKRAVPQDWIESTTFGPYVRFSCGIVAGIGASLVTQPADVLKTKMQLYPDKFRSIPHVAAYVYKKYGAQGYFKGLLPRMIRRTMIAAMSWTVYEQMMNSMGLK